MEKTAFAALLGQNRAVVLDGGLATELEEQGHDIAVLMDGSEYTGAYGVSRSVLRDFHEQRLALLDRTDADVLACETIPSLEEAAVLAELLANVRTPAWVSFTCCDEKKISDGTPVADAAAAIDWLDAGANLVGGCCRVGPTHVAAIVESQLTATR